MIMGWEVDPLPSGKRLIAIDNGHRNSGFSRCGASVALQLGQFCASEDPTGFSQLENGALP